MTVWLPAMLATMLLRSLWELPAETLQKIAVALLLAWPPVFAVGFLWNPLHSLALLLSLLALSLYVRSLRSGGDDGDWPWDFFPRNPLEGKRKRSKSNIPS